ncbi:hypothetical protein HU200_043602 [Digitaria exilis]|uniref:Uncharacterized protein n=1 Tax=Digitaria exilis TaxID=1010633 RepID=A0A835B0C7_9POAL|nr:hypothetical protein HU200_043602 [Digitaria exilis]
MKTLCPKPGKGGKIHPSPAEDPIAAAFRLLPAAILVLVAGLTPEDQRVLAHLVTRSFLEGWNAATAPPPEQARGGGGRRRRGHPPTVGCLCFECYGSFWTRWGCSPQHDRIHAALEAFEEHLNAAESAAASSPATPPSKRRDKGKRGRASAAATPPPPPPPMQSHPKSLEPPAVEAVLEPSSPPPSPSCPPPTPPPAPAACPSENKENVPEPEAPAEAKAEECGGEVAAEAEEERKRGWADVMGGVLNPRRWGIWSPAVESAT